MQYTITPSTPRQLSLIHLIREIYAKQLLPRVHLDEVQEAFITSSLHTTLSWPALQFCAVILMDDFVMQ